MPKKLLLSIIVVLLITNIASLLLLNRESKVAVDSNNQTFSAKDAVATVNGEEIIYVDWVNSLIDSSGKKELETMIDREVVSQLANQYHIEVDEKVIQREISLLTSMQGVMTEEEFKELEEGWRDDIIYRYQLEKLLTMDVSVSEEEIQQFYNTYGNQYNFTEAMQISHILVEDMETAEKVKRELDQGASFTLLAKEYSMDEETRDNGGYIGFIHTNSQFFPNGYEDVAEGMNEYSYSEPFPVDDGVAIMYFHRKLPSIDFTYEEMKPYIESELALQQLNQSLSADPLWEQLDIEWIYGR
ncbi:peptidylprolyl isomerase [Oceanobacillus salinisoli]|uniref:peptidylprolyl isomerase n=1 Tax=Oceanobacillus salinisoli TaxID=2678611 RepID=UPI0012E22919|nr:peptidylprolyl isomerase [Oceanobacillus salinisoli]